MADIVTVDRLEDGRVGVTLAGESAGFYAWTKNDAIYVAVALMRFFDSEKKEKSEEVKSTPMDIA